MIINKKRALAYTARCGVIKPIEGADNIELMAVNGWNVIVKKGEFKEGDLCVYFEIAIKRIFCRTCDRRLTVADAAPLVLR